jgi:Fe-S cluster biosynthesis and repair protein YggX
MTSLIHCRLLGSKKNQLQYCPFPGAIGKHIQKHYSQEAWTLWLNEQTKILNEQKLNPLDPDAKAKLMDAMTKFFDFEQNT